MTAHYLVHDTHPVAPGDAVLVHAGAGGMGLLLCQMARAAGATVIATTSSEEKDALARAAGAHETLRYGSDLADRGPRRRRRTRSPARPARTKPCATGPISRIASGR
jgi:NADPH2:quinone reductase